MKPSEEGEGTDQELDIFNKIAEKHGGKIEVEGEVGVGTKHTIYLPIND
ncbi:MAG: hypothetical protein KAH48_05015 [Chlorobi bacterium]|nr:hypothetical protein [Chlorobiota bacterium]